MGQAVIEQGAVDEARELVVVSELGEVGIEGLALDCAAQRAAEKRAVMPALHQVVLCAMLHCLDGGRLVVEACPDDDRHLRHGKRKLPQACEAKRIRQRQVEHHHVALVALCYGERGRKAGNPGHLEPRSAAGREQALDQFRVSCVVLDEKYSDRLGLQAEPPPAGSWKGLF